MAMCEYCKQEMVDPNVMTCRFPAIYINGKSYNRSVYHFEEKSGHCHDCGIKHGGLHHPGCDVERCPRCGGQLIFCDCKKERFQN